MFDSFEFLTVVSPSVSVLSHTLLGSCALMDIRTSQAMHHLKALWTPCSSHLTCRRSDSFLTWLLTLGSRHSYYILVCGTYLHGESRNSIQWGPRQSGCVFRSGTATPAAGEITSRRSAFSKQARTSKSTGQLQRDWLEASEEQHDELVLR